ncbi:MAG: histidine phosphatase family protein [Bacteroidales bacterium]
MKKLIFVRHGRAEEPTSMIPDFERSLTTKGKNISDQMAAILKTKEKDPGVFISSPAFRALETALVFARVFGTNPDAVILKSLLYNRATLNSFADIIEDIPDDINAITFFGHNPSFTEIPDRLSKDGCDFLPKSAIVGLYFKTDKWKGIVHEKGKIEYFLKPEKHHE